MHKKFTLISATAGAGKSTVTRQWLADRRAQVAWVRLDASDNQLQHLVWHIADCIRTIVPSACPITHTNLNASKPPSKESLIGTLKNELSQINAEWVLVLDDYEAIESDDGHEVLRMLIEVAYAQPQLLNLVVLTRSTPPVPIGNLRVRDQISELNAVDLQFTLPETEQLITKNLGHTLNLTPSDFELLHTRTEGWVAGLRLCQVSLMAQHSNPKQFLQLFSGNHRLIRDYLFEQVFGQQSPELQRWLMATALLNGFCVELCDAMFENPNRSSHITITYLEQNNLFLIPLDDENRWYRYHNLARDFLRHRANQLLNKDEVKSFQIKAGIWLTQAGLYDEAIAVFAAAQAYTHLTELVEQHFFDAVQNQSLRVVLKRWLSHIPDAVIEKQPALLVRKAEYAYYCSNIETAATLLVQAQTLLDRLGDTLPTQRRKSIRLDIVGLKLILDFISGNYNAVLHGNEAFIAAIVADPKLLRYESLLYYVNAKTIAGEFDEANALLSKGIAQADQPNSKAVRFLYCAKGAMHLYQGNLDGMQGIGKAIMAMQTPEITEHTTWGWGVGLLGWAHYERNQFAEAENYFAQIEPYYYDANVTLYINCLFMRALMAQFQHQTQTTNQSFSPIALKHWQHARTYATEWGSKMLQKYCDLFELRLAWASGNASRAQQLLNPNDRVRNESTSSFFFVTKLNELYGLFIQPDIDSLQTALALCDIGLQELHKAANTLQKLYYHVFRAGILCRLGRVDEAIAERNLALALGAAQNFIRAFLDIGSPMQHLLQNYAVPSQYSTYVSTLLNAFAPAAPPQANAPMATAAISLSDREQEVLRLWAKRNTRKEIAASLFISDNTVKTHMRNIYTKLGVNNSSAAVAKATRLGLI
ncbi:MAG: LuxR C-terminal-related transcriptional regulator [Anaerolineae bacterium]|nr:LuxR C-terminal-related transcriptional regulator [Anaerolineae bacterium]